MERSSVLALAVALALPHAACLDPAAMAVEGGVEQIRVAGAGGAGQDRRAESPGERVFEALVLVEAADGGLLVEHPDERLELLQPTVILGRESVGPREGAEKEKTPDRRTERERQRAESARLLAELPEGFECLFTRHYCICHDTSQGYARWCGGLLERLHGGFENYWSRGGLPLVPRDRPLVVVLFRDRAAFITHAGDTLGAAAARVAGYYDIMTNRIITYDLSGTARNGRGFSGSPGDIAMLRNPATAGLVATLVHEATHQMAFSCGMHRRLAAIPLWVSEGVACFFETPDLESTSGWKGIGRVNGERLERWRSGWRPGALESLVVDDGVFRSAERGLDAYAGAWALTYYLLQARREEFTVYLRQLAAKPPLGADSAERRLDDFRAAFGQAPADMEPVLVRFMARQAVR
jgi:hypothetical protein